MTINIDSRLRGNDRENDMKIALVHDFLKEYGGAERVLETLHEIWPKAPIYTSFVDWEGLGPHQERIKNWKIITSWAQKIPFITKLFSPLRFLAPNFFASFDFSDFDVVVSSTNAYYAKGVITKPSTIHICYCHTPPRSLYGYQTRMNWQKNPIINIYGQIINHFLRKFDFLAAQKVDYFIANSYVVKERIAKFYRRDSTVIYPPVGGLSLRGGSVSTDEAILKTYGKRLPRPADGGTRNDRLEDSYYLYVGKLAVAKNVNLAISAAQKMGFRLKVVGKDSNSVIPSRSVSEGEESFSPKSFEKDPSTRPVPYGVGLGRDDKFGSNIEFLGEVSDEELTSLYQNCNAVIFPAIDEDFGIVPVEAMSFGKPVIALKSGGVVETVVDGKTGIFFEEPTVESLITAIKQLNRLTINPKDCIRQANKFSKAVFTDKIKKFVTRHSLA